MPCVEWCTCDQCVMLPTVRWRRGTNVVECYLSTGCNGDVPPGADNVDHEEYLCGVLQAATVCFFVEMNLVNFGRCLLEDEFGSAVFGQYSGNRNIVEWLLALRRDPVVSVTTCWPR